jgi:hypothetical protein
VCLVLIVVCVHIQNSCNNGIPDPYLMNLCFRSFARSCLSFSVLFFFLVPLVRLVSGSCFLGSCCGPSDGAIYRLPFVIHVSTTNLWQSSYVSSTLEGLPPLIQRVGLGSWRRTWLQSCQSIDHGLLCFWFLCSHPWNSLAFFPLRPLPVHEQINHPHPFHPVDCHFSSCFFFHCCCFVLQSQHRPRYNILRPFSFAPCGSSESSVVFAICPLDLN